MGSRELKQPKGHIRINLPIVRKTNRPYVFVGTRVRRPRGQEIFEFRSAMGLTRTELCRMMRVSLPSLVLWESGKFEPKELAWHSFKRVKRNWLQRIRRSGKDLDGGPAMS